MHSLLLAVESAGHARFAAVPDQITTERRAALIHAQLEPNAPTGPERSIESGNGQSQKIGIRPGRTEFGPIIQPRRLNFRQRHVTIQITERRLRRGRGGVSPPLSSSQPVHKAATNAIAVIHKKHFFINNRIIDTFSGRAFIPLFSPTPEQYKGRFFLENTSPKDQQQRNHPILLPVSENTETAIRFSDPILHRAENISISRMSAEIQSPTRY